MPDEKRDRIKKIASEANGSYSETVAALAQFGLDQMEMLVAQEKTAASAPLIPQIFGAHMPGALKAGQLGGLVGASAQGASAQAGKFDEPLGAMPKAFLMSAAVQGFAGPAAENNARSLFPTHSPTASETSAVSALSAFFRKQKAKDV